MDLMNGDILLTRSNRLISRIIRAVLQRPGDPAPYSHVGGYVGNYQVIEAKHRVECTPLDAFLGDKSGVMIIRMVGVIDEDRQAMADMGRLREGGKYGYIKVGILQGLDQFFNTNWFTKTLSITNRPYCSELWASIYYDVTGHKINGVSPRSCEPDDWEDEVLHNSHKWQIIYKKEISC